MQSWELLDDGCYKKSWELLRLRLDETAGREPTIWPARIAGPKPNTNAGPFVQMIPWPATVAGPKPVDKPDARLKPVGLVKPDGEPKCRVR
jgi:hypothetical protein